MLPRLRGDHDAPVVRGLENPGVGPGTLDGLCRLDPHFGPDVPLEVAWTAEGSLDAG